MYALRHPKRDALAKHLTDKGVGNGIHYPVPVHLQKAFAELGYKPGDFPHAERATQETLSLPMFPELKPEQVDEVAAAVKSFSG